MSRVAAVCVLGLAFNALVFGPSLKLTAEGRNDFMSIYSGTRLAFTGQMYDRDANLRVQRQAAGWENVNHLFMRPPFAALALWPLGRLPYIPAAWIWIALSIAAIVLFCRVWPGDGKLAALACCWSLPLFHVVANGQDVAILLVVLALAIREMLRDHDEIAGLLLALCSVKFHLFLLLPVFLLARKRWRVLAGLAGGGSILFLLSFLAAPLDWPARYFAFLRDPVGNPWPNAMPNLHGLTISLPHPESWQAAGTLTIVLLAWIAARRSFDYGLAAALVGGILVAPHAYLSDCALAIPALLLTFPLAMTVRERAFHFLLFIPPLAVWMIGHPAWPMALAFLVYLGITALRYTQGMYRYTNHPMLVRFRIERLPSQ